MLWSILRIKFEIGSYNDQLTDPKSSAELSFAVGPTSSRSLTSTTPGFLQTVIKDLRQPVTGSRRAPLGGLDQLSDFNEERQNSTSNSFFQYNE